MRSLTFSILGLLSQLSHTVTVPTSQAPSQQIATYQNFVENIITRFNGHLLVTSLTTSSVIYLDPAKPDSNITLPPLPFSNGISGIAELKKDFYVVAPGMWNTSERRAAADSFSVWTLDFRNVSIEGGSLNPKMTKLFDFPDVTAVNGLAAIPGTDIVLASESDRGVVYRFDIAERTYSKAIGDEAFAPLAPAPDIGINGIRVKGCYLYYANSAKGTLGRVPISSAGEATGDIEILTRFDVENQLIPDDFAVGENGDVWVAVHSEEVVKVDTTGKKTVVVSGMDKIPDPTSLVFGRGSREEEEKIYVNVNRIGEERILGGVVEIDVSEWI